MRSRRGGLFVLPRFMIDSKLKAPCYVDKAEIGHERAQSGTAPVS